MGLAPDFGLLYEPKPYHRRVYRLDELDAAVDQLGLPQQPVGYDGYDRRPFETYIEIQLWTDDPIRSYLHSQRAGEP